MCNKLKELAYLKALLVEVEVTVTAAVVGGETTTGAKNSKRRVDINLNTTYNKKKLFIFFSG